jgi:hypothetical protein
MNANRYYVYKRPDSFSEWQPVTMIAFADFAAAEAGIRSVAKVGYEYKIEKVYYTE